jgi:hypothetical protein
MATTPQNSIAAAVYESTCFIVVLKKSKAIENYSCNPHSHLVGSNALPKAQKQNTTMGLGWNGMKVDKTSPVASCWQVRGFEKRLRHGEHKRIAAFRSWQRRCILSDEENACYAINK